MPPESETWKSSLAFIKPPLLILLILFDLQSFHSERPQDVCGVHCANLGGIIHTVVHEEAAPRVVQWKRALSTLLLPPSIVLALTSISVLY